MDEKLVKEISKGYEAFIFGGLTPSKDGERTMALHVNGSTGMILEIILRHIIAVAKDCNKAPEEVITDLLRVYLAAKKGGSSK